MKHELPPKRGTPEWEEELRQSQASVEAYFTYVVGPYDPNAPPTVRVHINPNSGLVTQMPSEDQQPIPDTTGLFQKTHK